jgi:hypothetical protein
MKIEDKVRRYRKTQTIGHSESNTRGNGGLVWSEPGIALGLPKDPVEQGVVAVVVHREEHNQRPS